MNPSHKVHCLQEKDVYGPRDCYGDPTLNHKVFVRTNFYKEIETLGNHPKTTSLLSEVELELRAPCHQNTLHASGPGLGQAMAQAKKHMSETDWKKY